MGSVYAASCAAKCLNLQPDGAPVADLAYGLRFEKGPRVQGVEVNGFDSLIA